MKVPNAMKRRCSVFMSVECLTKDEDRMDPAAEEKPPFPLN
jgi:hypothetical protein